MKKKSAHSETDSLSSSHTLEDMKEKSKIWTEEEIELLRMLLKNYGTDFHILSTFFPKKTKNQIKVEDVKEWIGKHSSGMNKIIGIKC